MPRITYSPAFTLVPTYECINRCTYCNFRQDIGAGAWLTLDRARDLLQSLQGQGICEVLILAGEVSPQSPQRQAWIDLIYDCAALALELGFLPHTNAGYLTPGEMTHLKTVNVSLGVMLEQVTPTLTQTVHRQAPTKAPHLRIEQLSQAGELGIPFTTGLLLGIGETATDRLETLHTIATIHQAHGHIQEVILQPYSPGPASPLPPTNFEISQLPALVHQAREILPPEITIQVPPNLIPDWDILWACIAAGARDLGGLVPHDHVNPTYAHPDLMELETRLATAGWTLIPRLPVYPHLIHHLPEPLKTATQAWQRQHPLTKTPATIKMI